jgi:hypothetical protein
VCPKLKRTRKRVLGFATRLGAGRGEEENVSQVAIDVQFFIQTRLKIGIA